MIMTIFVGQIVMPVFGLCQGNPIALDFIDLVKLIWTSFGLEKRRYVLINIISSYIFVKKGLFCFYNIFNLVIQKEETKIIF